MNRIALLLMIVLFSCCRISAQRKGSEDVLYLKNQWILRGVLVQRNDSAVKIRTQDGSIFAFSSREVDSITRAAAWSNSAVTSKGLRSFTELGPLIAGRTSINGVTTAAFSFQTFLGYSVTSHFIPGLGAGADLYATQTILPVFVSLRGDIVSDGNIIPFYFADLGYGINITQQSSDGTDFKGGLLYAAGAGIRIPFSKAVGFLLSVGYRYQHTSYYQAGGKQEITYNRLALRAGFYF